MMLRSFHQPRVYIAPRWDLKKYSLGGSMRGAYRWTNYNVGISVHHQGFTVQRDTLHTKSGEDVCKIHLLHLGHVDIGIFTVRLLDGGCDH